jgi:hypothetical protein
MDPYLEAYWLDVHARLVLYACDQFRGQLDGGLKARVEERQVFQLGDESPTETFIRISDPAAENRLVTIVEFLTKRTKSRGAEGYQYRREQMELIKSGVNVVEIDLIRGGEARFDEYPMRLPGELRKDYLAWASRSNEPSRIEAYTISLKERLPAILIPSREDDKYLVLEIQDVVDAAYEKGAYDDIDYRIPPEPPLDAENENWADQLLRSKGLR